MRAWRTREGILVEEGRTATPVISTQLDELPEDPRWRELHEYVLLDPYGIVLRRHPVRVWSLEDDLGMTVFAIVDGSLRSLTVILHTGATWRVNKEEEVVLSDLRPIPADEAETWELIEEGRKSDLHLGLHRLEQKRREAGALVAPLGGMAEGDDPEFLRVLELVRGRVEAYGSEVGKKLLAVLARFGVLYRSLRKAAHPATGAFAAFSPALDSLLLACRHHSFDRTLQRKLQSPAPIVGSFQGASEAERAEVRSLVETLAALEKELREDADGQEMADANSNAAEFRRAAVHVAQARERLSACLDR